MKTLKIQLSIGITLFMLVAPRQLLAEKKIDLEYHLHQNDQYVTIIKETMNIDMKSQGQAMNMKGNDTENITTAVDEAGTNSVQTSTTFNKMTLSVTFFGKTTHYDSSDPSTYASPAAKSIRDQFKKIIGKSYRTYFDRSGNITRYDFSQIGLDNATPGQLKAQDIYVVFPNHGLEVGNSWEADLKLLKDEYMSIHVKYTLVKVMGDQAFISFIGDITAKKTANQPLTIIGAIVGKATVDIPTGWTTKLNGYYTINVTNKENGALNKAAIMGTLVKTSVKK